MECTLCNKQYVGKAEIYFYTRWNNHRKDVKDPNAILVSKHFQAAGHNFNKLAKFIIKDKLVRFNSTEDVLRERLIQREQFWIKELKTLVSLGMNQGLSE